MRRVCGELRARVECRQTRARRPKSAMPTNIIAILHILDEVHAEAICAAALSHVQATSAARLPIKVVILHNRPRTFMDPLATLINAHITNALFCSYGDLADGRAAHALFPLTDSAPRPGSSREAHPGHVGEDWEIAPAVMAHEEALQTLVVQVAMGCTRHGMQTALCAARASTVVSADDVWQALVHFQVTPVAHGVQDAVACGAVPAGTAGGLPSMARCLLVRLCAPLPNAHLAVHSPSKPRLRVGPTLASPGCGHLRRVLCHDSGSGVRAHADPVRTGDVEHSRSGMHGNQPHERRGRWQPPRCPGAWSAVAARTAGRPLPAVMQCIAAVWPRALPTRTHAWSEDSPDPALTSPAWGCPTSEVVKRPGGRAHAGGGACRIRRSRRRPPGDSR